MSPLSWIGPLQYNKKVFLSWPLSITIQITIVLGRGTKAITSQSKQVQQFQQNKSTRFNRIFNKTLTGQKQEIRHKEKIQLLVCQARLTARLTPAVFMYKHIQSNDSADHNPKNGLAHVCMMESPSVPYIVLLFHEGKTWVFTQLLTRSLLHNPTKHILTGCKYALRSYMWRHNEVLEILVEAVKICCGTANKSLSNITNKAIHFVKEGNISKLSHKNKHRSLFDGCMDWHIATDLEHHFLFQTEVALMTQHPDIVIWSFKLKNVFVIELTAPFEENFDCVHQHKLEKYEDLQDQCVRNDWIINVFPLEVRWRGFITNSTSKFLTNLGLFPSNKRKYIKKIQNKALTASVWTWQSHRVTSMQQSLVKLRVTAGALLVGGDDVSALKLCLNPESSSDEGFVGSNVAV